MGGAEKAKHEYGHENTGSECRGCYVKSKTAGRIVQVKVTQHNHIQSNEINVNS